MRETLRLKVSTAHNAVRFLKDHVLEEFPFPIQRVQMDRGGEFFGTPFQRALMDRVIKFRPIRPYSPHLNGKVELSQRKDCVEFYATIEPNDPEMESKLKEGQHFYNWVRPHGAHGGDCLWSATSSGKQARRSTMKLLGGTSLPLKTIRARLCSQSTHTTPETRFVILTVKDWRAALNRFAIIFEDRMPSF